MALRQSKKATKPKAAAKPKKAKEPDKAKPDKAPLRERVDAVRAEKELRGRNEVSPLAGRDERDRSVPEPLPEVDKREWKEARNAHPGPTTVGKNRPEVVEEEPAREHSAEEVADKELRGRYLKHG